METKSVCVVFHLGTPSEWDFYKTYFYHLSKAVPNFDLYVSFFEKEKENELKEMFNELTTNIFLFPIENKGLDAGGLLTCFDYMFKENKRYDYLLKIHTKTTANQGIPNWRGKLMDATCGSVEQIQKCLTIFETEPMVGCIGAQSLLWTEGPSHNVDEWAQKIGFRTRNPNQFIAGTMFWIRWDLLTTPFRKIDNLLDVVSKMYPGKPNHETEGHFLERIYGIIVQSWGHTIKGV